MPSRREARNNPYFDPQYAFLGLHQAAHSGNVGLVEYALSEGQPVDTVWDGITALHAAAAGGSEHVARLLIEKGADVNLGRQYVEKREMKLRAVSSSSSLISSPDSSIPSDRSEALLNPGSTPLHYACAYNNAGVARLLLAAGAAPHIPDKRGVTPLDLLPPSTTVPSSQTLSSSPPTNSLRAVIREYYENEKAKEKEFNKSQSSQTLRSHQSGKAGTLLGIQKPDEDVIFAPPTTTNSPNGTPTTSVPSNLNRVAAKRSLENLLSMGSSVSPRRIPPPLSPNSGSNLSSRKSPPPSPAKFTFGNATASAQSPVPTHSSPGTLSSSPPPYAHNTERRPSLPQVFSSSSSGSSVSRPQMPMQQSPITMPNSDPFTQPAPSSNQGNRNATLPLPPNAIHAHSPSMQSYNSAPPNQPSSDASRPNHAHHSHTHSATLPSTIANNSAAAASSSSSRPPRTKRSLLSLFSKTKEERDDREKDRGRSKEKDKERERERSFSRPSFSTLSRPSFSAFNNSGSASPVPIPLPSRPSPQPSSHSHSRVPTANPSPSQIVLTPPSETLNHNSVHTAPPERTTFDVPRSSRLKNPDEEDEDEEEYGVELGRRDAVYGYPGNDEVVGDDGSSSGDEDEDDEGEEGEEVEVEDISTSESGSEGDSSQDEDVAEPNDSDGKHAELVGDDSGTASKRVADNSVSGSRIIASASAGSNLQSQQAGPSATSTSTAGQVTFPVTSSAPVTTSSPSRPSILRDTSNGIRQKNYRGLSNNGSDGTGGLHRSGSLRFELEGDNPNYQGATTASAVNDQKNNGGSAGAGAGAGERKTGGTSTGNGNGNNEGAVAGRRSNEGTRSPLIRKKSSLGLKERGSLSVLREGTIESGASPVKRTPKSGMVPLPPSTSSPSRYRTSPSDSKITTSPTRARSRTSSSLSLRSPHMAVPPLPMPPMKYSESATATNPNAANTSSYIAGGSSSDSEDDLSPRLRTHSLRSRTPISAGVDLRSVSSHAEAEALVRLAAKEIIEMGSTNNNNNNSKEQIGEMPQMSLAEQLARYGETLHLERRFARGEAQRWKHVEDDEDLQMVPDEESSSRREAQKAAEEEEERRVKAKERMMWTQRNLDKYAKAEAKDKDKDKDRIKEGRDKDKDKEKQESADLVGYGLHRTASLEKENGRTAVLPFTKTPGSNGVRRPHTSDSVQSNGSGSTVTPPRFGHNSTHSSSNIRFTPALQPLRVFQRETPRTGSFDYDRPKFSGAMPMAGRRSEDLYRKRYEETEEEDEESAQQQQSGQRLSPAFGYAVPTSQSPTPPLENAGSMPHPSSNMPTVPSDSPVAASSNVPNADEFGYNTSQHSSATTGTGRPLRQRFGLKSLFGKNK